MYTNIRYLGCVLITVGVRCTLTSGIQVAFFLLMACDAQYHAVFRLCVLLRYKTQNKHNTYTNLTPTNALNTNLTAKLHSLLKNY